MAIALAQPRSLPANMLGHASDDCNWNCVANRSSLVCTGWLANPRSVHATVLSEREFRPRDYRHGKSFGVLAVLPGCHRHRIFSVVNFPGTSSFGSRSTPEFQLKRKRCDQVARVLGSGAGWIVLDRGNKITQLRDALLSCIGDIDFVLCIAVAALRSDRERLADCRFINLRPRWSHRVGRTGHCE